MNTDQRCRIRKLAALALSTDSEPEASKAWSMVLRMMRDGKEDIETAWRFLAPHGNPKLWFGKHKGRRLDEVWVHDRDYLVFVAMRSKNQWLRQCACQWIGKDVCEKESGQPADQRRESTKPDIRPGL